VSVRQRTARKINKTNNFRNGEKYFMKNLKKILAMALICVMLTAVLAACGDGHKDWEDIESKGEMIIGVTPNPPMNYQDESGEWTLGFDTEFAWALCEILGVTAVFQEIDWGAKETELKAMNIDAIWNGMTITPSRAEEMDIAMPYMNNGQVLVVRAENKDQYTGLTELPEGVKAVAEIGSTLENTINDHAYFAKVKSDYVGVDKQITGLLEVKSGTADVTLVDLTLAVEVIKPGTDYSDLAYIEIADFVEQFGIAFRKNSPETLKKVNDAIKQLKDNGTLLAIAEKYGLEDLLVK